MTDGQELRDEALELLERSRKEWLEEARQIAVSAYLRRRLDHPDEPDEHWISADDVRVALPFPPGVDGRVMGAVFNVAYFKKIGYTNTKNALAHHRPIAKFIVTDP